MSHIVSIIIPVYNVSAYVQNCVYSVMSQSFTDIECIIVDDATNDDSIIKCERLIKDYEGPISFRIIHHEENKGLSAARNTGIKASRGEYVYYLDGDDEITSDCIEKLVSYIGSEMSIEMVQGNYIMISEGREDRYPLKSDVILNNDDAFAFFYDKHIIYDSVWNKLIKRSFINNHQLYCKEGIIWEDTLWSFYLIKHLCKAYICSDVTYLYHRRHNSIVTGSEGKKIGYSLTIVYSEILNNLTSGKERIELSGFLYRYCKRYVKYISAEPMFADTIELYKKRALQYGCWYVYLVVQTVRISCCLGNPFELLQLCNKLRWNIKKLK